MENVLIPTDYSEDTLSAMEFAWRNAINGEVRIILLSLSSSPDSIGYTLFLPGEESSQWREERLMQEWEIRSASLNINVELIEHHQYGASLAIINQIAEQFAVRSIIIPYSVQSSQKEVYMEAVDSLKRTELPLRLMNEIDTSVPH